MPTSRIRFGIGFKIGLMATVLVIITTVFIGTKFYFDSRKVLVEHELQDLKDETNLWGRQFLEPIARLRTDTLRLAGLPEIQYYLGAWSSWQSNKEDETLSILREKLASQFHKILDNNYLKAELIEDAGFAKEHLLIDPEIIVQPDGIRSALKEPPGKLIATGHDYLKSIRKLIEEGNFQPQSVFLSPIALPSRDEQKVKSDNHPVLRAAVPLFRTGDEPLIRRYFGVVVITMDFDSIVEDFLRRSPRHHVILTDERGRLLVHPNRRNEFSFDPRSRHGDAFRSYKDLPEFLEDPDLAPIREVFEKNAATDDDLKRRGVQVAGGDDGLQLTQATCHMLWIKPKNLDGRLPDGAKEQLTKLIEKWNDEYVWTGITNSSRPATDRLFRCSRVTSLETAPFAFRVRAEKRETIKAIQKDLESVSDFIDHIEGPVELKSFALQFYQLEYDPRDRSRWMGLMVFASYEEILHDLKEQARSVVLIVVLLILGGAALAFLFSRFLTRPLKLMTRVSRKYAGGDTKVDVPQGVLSRRDEIGRLAGSFQEMMTEVRQRGAAIRMSEARLRSVVETAAEGIMMVVEDGTITSFNEAAAKIFGYEPEEIVGEKFTKLYPDDYSKMFAAWLSDFHETGQSRMMGNTVEAVGRRKDGSEFSLELALSVTNLGEDHAGENGKVLFTTIFRDITERKEAEQSIKQLNQELRSLNEDLDQRVKDRTRDLEIATEQALEASRAKDRFLAKMSHELRTPLNAVIGYSEVIQEEVGEMDPEDLTDVSEKIKNAGNHLLALINEILDLAKIEAGKMDLVAEEFDVCGLVEEVSDTLQPAAQKNANKLLVRCDESVGRMNSDRMKLRQILFNLGSNACKFTKNGEVRIEVARADSDSDRIEFRVADSGIGMTPEQLERVFEPFTQADESTTRRFGGTGLGLTICREFARFLGGDIAVDSAANEGSTFTVWLPQTAPEPRAGVKDVQSLHKPTPAEPRMAPATLVEPPGDEVVLVIDDDPTVCELMTRFLGKEGLRVEVATSGAAGIEKAKEIQPTVITLDVSMPGMDGWETIDRLKNDADTRDIPVIMVTMMDDRSRGYSLGAAEYISKPIDWEHLVPLLHRIIEEREKAIVLVVDDDDMFRESVRHTLVTEGWQVLEAENGRAAVAQLEQHRPQVILLDLLMPEMDGLEFLNQLRGREDWSRIPVVMMTGLNPLMHCDEQQREQLKTQVQQVLLKGSYSREELLQEVYHRVAAVRENGRNGLGDE